MKRIIDIPDTTYAFVKQLQWISTGSRNYKTIQQTVINAIKFGVPIQDRWIPVSERLPEQANQSYLVTLDYGNGVICSCQRFFFGEGIGWNMGWNDDCVIAWQPLPEPYMRGEEE